MAKNSSYYVSSPSPFGQLATGFGKGLAESVPEELNHQRLKSGLQNLSENYQNMTPAQTYFNAAGIKGITPQALSDIQKISRLEAQRNRYPAQDNQSGAEQPGNAPIAIIPEQAPERKQSKALKTEEPSQPQQRRGQQGLLPITNPLLPQLQSIRPPTPQEFEQGIGRELALDPTIDIPEAERRYLGKRSLLQQAPEVEREKQQQAKGARTDTKEEFDERMKTRFQANDVKGIFPDVTGKAYQNFVDKAYEKLSTDPNSNVQDVVKDAVNDAEAYVRAKNRGKELAYRSADTKIWPQKKEG